MAVVGMFDGVHAGHRFLLDTLKADAGAHGLEPLAVTFSNHPFDEIAPARSPQLLTTPAEKAALLADAGVTPAVIPFDAELRRTSSLDFLRMLRNRFNVERLLLGFNNRFGHDAPSDFHDYLAIARNCGVELVQGMEYSHNGFGVSSSVIRGLLSDNGDAEGAAQLLGRPYTLTGTVGYGRQIGRQLGFPTANLQPADPRKLIPRPGVYAARAILPDGGATFGAVVNIGHRPTVDNSTAPQLSIEAHLLQFSGNLYGSEMQLQFIKRLRAEQKFPSLDALRMAIDTDRREAINILLPQ